MSSIIKWMLAGAAVLTVYRNRYKIVNLLLGQYFIRKLIIRYSMQLPFLRNRLMQGTFKM
ncbi:MAG TPA: hypothetical protein VNM69_17365 [Bacillus sp. (in: firmicutes)]|uniref:hypothetical protein n=1 Tax=Bacillus litorisediminis TaxID=2922713 RepID=UPI001FABBEEF|nr:hypothetical protein [Bacillus litorisediminis]HWO77637.1 hypothetical protein [Bacillus sp. (in: firmicutes)]